MIFNFIVNEGAPRTDLLSNFSGSLFETFYRQ
jgi:hypothetical protein